MVSNGTTRTNNDDKETMQEWLWKGMDMFLSNGHDSDYLAIIFYCQKRLENPFVFHL
jgi:hypothetical protein